MEKVSTAVTMPSGNISQQKLTIGLDLGDRYSAGETACPMKKQKNRLDSDRPSHGRRFHSNFDLFRLLSHRKPLELIEDDRNRQRSSSDFGVTW